MRIFALLAVVLLVPVWILKSLLPGSAGDYQITEIRSQGNTLFLRCLNDKGQAAGFIRGQGKEHAIIWNADSGITRLATPDGYSSCAMDINNSGETCGELRDPNNKPRACFWDTEGQLCDVGTLGGGVSMAWKLNDNGQVVGWAQTAGNVSHAFLWSKEQGIRDIDTRGSMHSNALGINNQGQVVGELSASRRERHAFLWQEETGMVDIHDKLEGSRTLASDINSSGQIIGQYSTADNLSRAFAWDKSKGFRDLRIVSEREFGCSPLQITDRGQGIALINEKRVKRFGFVIRQESDLSFLFDHRRRKLYLHKALPFETNYCVAYDINNEGQIIVSARKARSNRWYLMTPVDSARRSARKSE
jgi:probable HAF family extracellular repeat protein